MIREVLVAPTAKRNEALSVVILNDHGWINGGQAKIAIDSALQLRARGADVCFIAGVGPIDERLPQAGVECHAVGTADILSDRNRVRAATSGIWNTAAARVLTECLGTRDARTTVIHVHGWAKALSPSIGPIVTGSKAAHVYTLHEYFLGCPNGGFYNYRTDKICTLHALGPRCLTTRCDARGDHHKMWRVARQAVLRGFSGMPANLRDLIYLAPQQRSILQAYISPNAHWHYLPNPIGPRPATRIAAEYNDLFLFVGRLSQEKGAEMAAQAARLAGVRIAFCGDGERRDAIVRANPDAQMLGWVAAEEIGEWMRRARCLVFPSLWYEAYPLVVAEALRLGLPVLVADTSLATSLVEDGVSGRHVLSGDARAWTEAMASLRRDAQVAAYSEAAFAAGHKLLDEEEYVTRLLNVYDSALLRKQSEATATREWAR